MDLPIEHLKNTFQALGHFYCDEDGYPCRRELLLLRRGAVADGSPDAVFVMMNPGGSAPCEEPVPGKFVPTRPDRTQYQLMCLMEAFRWRFVRVLNLSDLRCTDSKVFVAKASQFGKSFGDHHSIFSAPRRAELLQVLARAPDAPIVAAWGVGAGLRELAVSALEALAGRRVLGLGRDRPWQFRHPLPRNNAARLAWLRDMANLLEAEGRRSARMAPGARVIVRAT